jgi:hypothetical protein
VYFFFLYSFSLCLLASFLSWSATK